MLGAEAYSNCAPECMEAAAAEDAMSNESSGEGLDDDGGSSGDASADEEGDED